MLLLIPAMLVFAAALILVIMRIARPTSRSAWLLAVGFAFLAWMSVLLLQPQLPLSILLPSWKPNALFSSAAAFILDGLSWPFAVSVTTLVVALLLTAPARDDFPNQLSWALILTLCGLGFLAVTANNPFTLVMVWAAFDITEVLVMLRSVNTPTLSERAVIAFAIRGGGIILALLAQVIGNLASKTVTLASLPPHAGLLLLVAAGLRLGVLPVYSAYGSNNVLRRDIGTALHLLSAAASLIVLARIPTASLLSPITPVLLILALVAAFYGGWMWLRAPDELTGSPYWVIGLSSLAIACALRNAPAGATAWGAALILAGGALFISSVQQFWLNRLLLIGGWSISALPFSLTALGWTSHTGGFDWTLPAIIVAQAFLIAGFMRHTSRTSTRPPFESQAAGAMSVYPVGIGLLLFVQLLLGIWGWDGAFQIGNWVAGIAAIILTAGLLWAVPRFPTLNPVPAQWQGMMSHSRLDQLYQTLSSPYRWLRNFSEMISNVLEGDGGILWTLLFLILFIALIVQRQP